MSARPAYRDANVLRWLVAYTASITGDVVYFLALTWAAVRVGGPSQVGLVVAAGALPRAVLMLGGGVVADRFGPRRVAVVSDAVRCAVILGAAAALTLASPGVWLLVTVALVFGAVDAVFMPAVGALPPLIAAPAQFARVQGMRGLSIRLSNAVGPLLAAAVLVTAGAAGAFAAAGILFALSLATLLTVRTLSPASSARPPRSASARASTRVSALRELADGLRYVRRHRMLAPLVVVIGLGEMCFSGPVATGLVLLAEERGWGAPGMGWIASAFSVGAAASALLLTVSARIPRAGLVMCAALLVTAGGAVALGRVASLPLAVLLGCLIGLTSGITTTVTGALLQTETDPRYLGRVTAVTTLCTLGLAPVLFPAVGVTVALWGADAFFAGCGVICLLAAGLGLAVPVLRRAELQGPETLSPVAVAGGSGVPSEG
ncbi:MFS transporter [Streptomyces sp. NBC_01298]|uniref:MFS transporter n=1 Tax=Streptomyces sp. NBC_01298 TaxID=2903817 RepID=UPI003FA3BBFD